MKLLLTLTIVIILFFTWDNSFSKSTLKLGIFRLKNLTKNKKLNYISSFFHQRLLLTIAQQSEIDAKQLPPLSKEVYIKTISKKYPNLAYAVYGSYSLKEENLININIIIVDLNHKIELDNIDVIVSLPVKSRFFKRLEQISENILWVIIGIPFQIYCNPHDSEVYIDKQFIGRAPLKKLSGKEGIHEIIVYKKGFQILRERFSLTRGQENIFFYPLKYQNFLKKKSKLNMKYVYSFASESYTKVDPYFPLLFSFEHFIRDFSFELETGIINFERTTTVSNISGVTELKTISAIPLTLMIKYHFFQEQFFSPYIGLGGGAVFISIAENKSGETNPIYYFTLGVNLGSIPVLNHSSRISFFLEGRYFNAGDVVVGESSFNPYGTKLTDNTQITLKGFHVIAGVSYIIF